MLWSEAFECEILPVMWSVFPVKNDSCFLNHTFCDVKYFYLLLSKYSLISGKGPLGGFRWKLLELTSVSRFFAYCTTFLTSHKMVPPRVLDITASYIYNTASYTINFISYIYNKLHTPSSAPWTVESLFFTIISIIHL